MKTLNSSPVFTPISIGNIKLKNRLVVAPMVTVYCDQDGMATERFIAYHETKAKGGWGMIIVEDYAVDPLGRGFWTPGLWKDEQIESHAQLTKRIHNAGSKIIAQIYHSGRQTTSAIIGEQPVSASPLPCPILGQIPRELSVPEIKKIISQFSDTALRAKKAGFDGVEVHGAYGYLIAQFMSKYSNKRSDEYGGSLEHRMRFPLEIVKDIREKCGPDFMVGFRISGDDKVPGRRTIEETKTIAIKLEKQGVDLLHISAGTYESTWAIIPPMNINPGWIVDYAEEVKRVVNIPVMTNVVTAQDVLLGKVSTKDKVVVAGGGQIGCETAIYLASLGKKVTIVEMLPTIAGDEEFTRRIFLMKAIKENNIEYFTGAKVKGINIDCVQCETVQQKLIEIEAETVVLALGMESNNTLAKELEGKVPIKVVGDAVEVRDALDAIREGFLAAVQA